MLKHAAGDYTLIQIIDYSMKHTCKCMYYECVYMYLCDTLNVHVLRGMGCAVARDGRDREFPHSTYRLALNHT